MTTPIIQGSFVVRGQSRHMMRRPFPFWGALRHPRAESSTLFSTASLPATSKPWPRFCDSSSRVQTRAAAARPFSGSAATPSEATPTLSEDIPSMAAAPVLTREQEEAQIAYDRFRRIQGSARAAAQAGATAARPSSSSETTAQEARALHFDSHQALLRELEPLLDVTKQQQAAQQAIKTSNALRSPSAFSTVAKQQTRQPTITIHASSNNTILTLAGANGQVISWASGGSCGLKKSARGSSESGLRAAQRIATVAKENNIVHVDVVTKGFGQGKEEAFRTLRAQGLRIGVLSDATPIPHGGCRPRKRRRV